MQVECRHRGFEPPNPHPHPPSPAPSRVRGVPLHGEGVWGRTGGWSLQTALSRERLCVHHRRRRRGSDAKGAEAAPVSSRTRAPLSSKTKLNAPPPLVVAGQAAPLPHGYVFRPSSSPPTQRGPQTPHSSSGGCPPQKANTYIPRGSTTRRTPSAPPPPPPRGHDQVGAGPEEPMATCVIPVRPEDRSAESRAFAS